MRVLRPEQRVWDAVASYPVQEEVRLGSKLCEGAVDVACHLFGAYDVKVTELEREKERVCDCQRVYRPVPNPGARVNDDVVRVVIRDQLLAQLYEFPEQLQFGIRLLAATASFQLVHFLLLRV